MSSNFCFENSIVLLIKNSRFSSNLIFKHVFLSNSTSKLLEDTVFEIKQDPKLRSHLIKTHKYWGVFDLLRSLERNFSLILIYLSRKFNTNASIISLETISYSSTLFIDAHSKSMSIISRKKWILKEMVVSPIFISLGFVICEFPICPPIIGVREL